MGPEKGSVKEQRLADRHTFCPPHGARAICGLRSKMEDAYTAIPFLLEVPIPNTQLRLEEMVPPRIATLVIPDVPDASAVPEVGMPAGSLAASNRAPADAEPELASQMEALHFFGVFDGHGGVGAALHCARTLHRHIVEGLTMRDSHVSSPAATSASVPAAAPTAAEPTAADTTAAVATVNCGPPSPKERTSPPPMTDSSFVSHSGLLVDSGDGSARIESSPTFECEGGHSRALMESSSTVDSSHSGGRLEASLAANNCGGHSSARSEAPSAANSRYDSARMELSPSVDCSNGIVRMEPSRTVDNGGHYASLSAESSPTVATEQSPSQLLGSSEQRPPLEEGPCLLAHFDKALHEAFLKTDEEFSHQDNAALVGTTAVVALVGSRQLYIGNCGDSRAVICRVGVAIALTEDHKAGREDETARVEAAGGQILFWNGVRVMGVLAVSRAIGDHCLRPFVIAQPEVTIIGRHAADELLMLASDGLWDVLSNQEACSLARRCLRRARHRGASRHSAAHIAATVLTRAALDRGSRDNVTVVVIDLARDELTQQCCPSKIYKCGDNVRSDAKQEQKRHTVQPAVIAAPHGDDAVAEVGVNNRHSLGRLHSRRE